MLNIVIAGCGRITKERHAPECEKNNKINIAGFYDINKARASEYAKRYGGKVYDNYEDVCADTNVDAVILCTANATHAQLSCKALQSGKHVLCEKPMCLNLEEAQQICDAEKASGKIFMVGQNQRFDNVNVEAKKLLKAGEIGNVLRFVAEFSHGGPEEWSIDAEKSFYFDKNAKFGAIADIGIHKIDLMRWMLEQEFVQVDGMCATLDKKQEGEFIKQDDNAIINVRTDKGVLGQIIASWTNYTACVSAATVFGSNGKITLSDSSSSAGVELVVHKKGEQPYNVNVENSENSGVVDAFAMVIANSEKSPVPAKEGMADIQIMLKACE